MKQGVYFEGNEYNHVFKDGHTGPAYKLSVYDFETGNPRGDFYVPARLFGDEILDGSSLRVQSAKEILNWSFYNKGKDLDNEGLQKLFDKCMKQSNELYDDTNSLFYDKAQELLDNSKEIQDVMKKNGFTIEPSWEVSSNRLGGGYRFYGAPGRTLKINLHKDGDRSSDYCLYLPVGMVNDIEGHSTPKEEMAKNIKDGLKEYAEYYMEDFKSRGIDVTTDKLRPWEEWKKDFLVATEESCNLDLGVRKALKKEIEFPKFSLKKDTKSLATKVGSVSKEQTRDDNGR